MTSSNSNDNSNNRNHSAPLKPGRRPSNKRTRRSSSSSSKASNILPHSNNNNGIGGGGSSLFQMNAVAECDDEDEAATLETMPDHLSTSASEASSKGSNNSQPPLLDFIGQQTCMASAWFTSCFPCSVVDINDSDTYVVDRLSRQSAMNVMYPNDGSIATEGGGSGIVVEGSVAGDSLSGSRRQQQPGGQGQGRTVPRNRSDQEKNLVFVRLPEQQQQQEQAPQPQTIPPIHSMPSMIQEEDDDGDDALEEVSLDSSSGVKKVRPIYLPHKSNPVYAPPKDPTKSKKFSVKKMFGRKKK